MKTRAQDLQETVAKKSKIRSEVSLSIKKLDEVYVTLRSELCNSIEWTKLSTVRAQLEDTRQALSQEIEKLQAELEREIAPMVKPQPRGVKLNGWNI